MGLIASAAMGEVTMYPDPKSQSQHLYNRALASLPGGNTRTTVFMKPYPIYAARGEGCRVFDVDGNEYIDCINNFTSLIHGHAHPALVAAATKQLALGSAFGLPTESEIDLAELLASRLPSVEQVRFTNSGTEAVMMALKAARAFTGRPKIAKCEGAYHGSYDYAEVSLDPVPEAWGRNAPVSVAYAKGTPDNVLADVITIPFNDAEAAVSLIREHGAELACVLVDPDAEPRGAGARRQGLSGGAAQGHARGRRAVDLREVITFRLGYRGAQGSGISTRSDHARQDHGRRLSGRRRRRQARNSWRCSIPVRQAGAAAWRHVFGQSGDDARRDRRDGAAGRCGVRAARRDRARRCAAASTMRSAGTACPAAPSGSDRC